MVISMIKLLLVDDEPLVLVGLQSMMPWDEFGVEICGTARNGGQAMELIEQTRPDIVIADIKMPVKSGLEVLTACREKYGRLPLFIILTCVEEYEYVRQALSGQAIDYLVKWDLTPEALHGALAKAIDVLGELDKDGSRHRISPTERLKMQSFYDRFFLRVFNNLFESQDELFSQQTELGVDFSFDAYAVCHCEMSCAGKEDLSMERLMGLYTSTTKMIWETVTKHLACYITNLDLRHFVITFCLSEHEVPIFKNVLCDVLEQSVNIVKGYFNVDLSCCVGEKVETPQALCNSYNTSLLTRTASDGSLSIMFYDNLSEDELISPSDNQKKTRKNKTVEDVKEYVRKNLDKRITLNHVADTFGFSPSYLSHLFAKHAQCGFVDYLTGEKIAHAKELLLSDDVKVYEIADQLGFESPFYFSKVFKKHTGLSPREYTRENLIVE